MPELPEVETSRRGIAPHIVGKTFEDVVIRQSQLRWPVPADLAAQTAGCKLDSVDRRGKYLLLKTAAGTVILHLGMSGNLRICDASHPVSKHDHIDFLFGGGTMMRFNDQRKFGAVLWTNREPGLHPLLAILGPEPLSDAFCADYLSERCLNRRTPIKSLIMDSHVVVGVGNIYANESLFAAGLHPTRLAGTLDLADCRRLCQAIKGVLQVAIDQGGTTLRDFVDAHGKPGYFQQSLSVYGRNGLACQRCSTPIQHMKIGQRASYFCGHCQK